MNYRRRAVDAELDELFGQVSAVALDGPKAVGKTTTAKQRIKTLIRLDDSAQSIAVRADPEHILSYEKPILLDEWQQVPEVWDVVRHAVDAKRVPGSFLLTGSATPYQEAPVHSGAGRIGRLRMRPMTLSERGFAEPTVSVSQLLSGQKLEIAGNSTLELRDYVAEIVASGFPGLRGLSGRALRFELDSYIQNVIERDIVQQGINVRRPESMRAWLTAYAAATSTTASYSAILNAATPGQSDKPSRGTANTYREVLESLWILDKVPAWEPGGSIMTRLGKSPKHQLADPALAARLLGLGIDSLLSGKGKPLKTVEGGMLGLLFEALATLSVRVYAQAAEARVCHLRTRDGKHDGGHEIDLLAVRPDGRVVAFEVKLANAVNDGDVKHLQWLRKLLGDKLLDAVVLNTGPRAYRRPDGIAVVPLGLLGM